MLSLAGHKIGSARSGGRKIHCKISIETEARRQRQARQQRETASDWLDAALSKLRRRNGKKRPPGVRSRGRIKPHSRTETPVWKLLFFSAYASGQTYRPGSLGGAGDRVHGIDARRRNPGFRGMESDDVTDTLNSLMAAGFVE